MADIKKVRNELFAGGQPSAKNLQQLAQDGFRSVVNLRSAHEPGTLANEQKEADAAGLRYVNIPLQPTEADTVLIDQFLSEVKHLPTPVYFHCGAGARASTSALITFATLN